MVPSYCYICMVAELPYNLRYVCPRCGEPVCEAHRDPKTNLCQLCVKSEPRTPEWATELAAMRTPVISALREDQYYQRRVAERAIAFIRHSAPPIGSPHMAFQTGVVLVRTLDEWTRECGKWASLGFGALPTTDIEEALRVHIGQAFGIDPEEVRREWGQVALRRDLEE